MLDTNFHEKAVFVKADVAAAVSECNCFCLSPCFHPHFQ
jgi:hypothetical protein